MQLKLSCCLLSLKFVSSKNKTGLPLDDIFDRFVQRSLANLEKKERKMSVKKDEPSLKHICVSRCPMCFSNLWGQLCLRPEETFIKFLLCLLQQNIDRRISMHHSGF